eukprot:CAMPEP_0174384876 /NCGR_PEP_ID=MMETSP0811_2-20130205/126208_1 /TAXON_ID=73025 ORGANISM="Eutreptiella gymnastica-like, Strain CCMP1594" /NCGR_SAMPLE_ID=MMETSP0811_2 /ASSEMBLY_ACC=CAM_ASM_000667 /LENGTH=70 /DNA_ID=CAMNT_0015538971 /DNA_START=351 /DNA_END=564 /DNA_ORIENTATION=-
MSGFQPPNPPIHSIVPSFTRRATCPQKVLKAVARNEGSKQVGEVQHTMSAPAPIWAGMSMSDSVAERGHH